MERLEVATGVLRILAHPHRLRICERLLESPCCVGDLERELSLKQNVVSQHLNLLRLNGIVEGRRTGRMVIYRVVHPGPVWLLDCIRDHMERAPQDGDSDGQ